MFARPRKRPWQSALGPGGTQHTSDAASTRDGLAYAYNGGSSPALSAESASRPLSTDQLPLAAALLPSYAPSSTVLTATTATAAATAIVLSGSTEASSSDKRTYPCRTCHAHFSSSSNRLRHERAKHKASEDRQLREQLASASGASVADVQLQHVASARAGVATVNVDLAAAAASSPSAAAASGVETDVQDLTAPEGDAVHEEALPSSRLSDVLSSSSAVSSSNDAHMAPLTAGATANAASVRHRHAAQLCSATSARDGLEKSVLVRLM